MKKLQLVYIPFKFCSCVAQPHYDLCTDEEHPENIACILTDSEGAKLVRKWIKKHNEELK